MDYQKYIELGFERTEMNDYALFKKTGYYGYCLEKKINDKMMVCVNDGELDKPNLYIKKTSGDTYHIMPIAPEVVIAMFYVKPKVAYTTFDQDATFPLA